VSNPIAFSAVVRLTVLPLDRMIAINYRLAPEVRFPDPLLDVVYGYFRLVEDLRIQPKNIVSHVLLIGGEPRLTPILTNSHIRSSWVIRPVVVFRSL
jgi:hypothetical protein